MRKMKFTKLVTPLLILSLLAPIGANYQTSEAAKKPKLSISGTSNLTVGSSKKISVKSSGIKKLVKVSWKASGKAVKLSKKTGKSIKISGKKAGKSTITATVKYKVTAKSKTLTKKLKKKVTVKANDVIATTAPTAIATTAATTAPTVPPVIVPTTPATLAPTPTLGPQNLLAALSPYVENVGTCISYNSGWGGDGSVADSTTTAFIKENYNSLTAENEMKPEAILGWQANTITVAQAKNQGIYVPDNYTEATVPVMNYTNIDKLLAYAKENGVRVRYHGLLWHEQTSNWFFRKNYNGNAGYVTPEIMDARIEYYIKNIMKHVYSSEYADVVYCWDVVNEYFHMTECIGRINADEPEKIKPENVKCYYEVYGESIFEDPSSPETSPVKPNPAYVKKAFKWAHEVLQEFNRTDSVELVYNDYDTDLEDVRDMAIAVTSYINEKDELNPNGDKLVTTIGMQGHDKFGRNSVEGHIETFEAIADAGLNLQITEMDHNKDDKTVEDQLKYWRDMIVAVKNAVKDGAHFTGFSWWGLYDTKSWLGTEGSPLLCGTSVNDKKPAYYEVIKAAYQY